MVGIKKENRYLKVFIYHAPANETLTLGVNVINIRDAVILKKATPFYKSVSNFPGLKNKPFFLQKMGVKRLQDWSQVSVSVKINAI